MPGGNNGAHAAAQAAGYPASVALARALSRKGDRSPIEAPNAARSAAVAGAPRLREIASGAASGICGQGAPGLLRLRLAARKDGQQFLPIGPRPGPPGPGTERSRQPRLPVDDRAVAVEGEDLETVVARGGHPFRPCGMVHLPHGNSRPPSARMRAGFGRESPEAASHHAAPSYRNTAPFPGVRRNGESMRLRERTKSGR